MDNELEVGPLAVYHNSSAQIQHDALNEVKKLTTPERIADLTKGRDYEYKPYTLPESRLDKIDPLSTKRRARRHMKTERHCEFVEDNVDVRKNYSDIDPHIEGLLMRPDGDYSDRYVSYYVAKIGSLLTPALMTATGLSLLYTDVNQSVSFALLLVATIGTTILTMAGIISDAPDYIGGRDIKKITAHLDETGYFTNKEFHDQQYYNLNRFVHATIDDVMDTQAWASDQLANTRSQIDLIEERDEINRRLHRIDTLKHNVISSSTDINDSLMADVDNLTESLMMRIAALHYWATQIHSLDKKFIRLALIKESNTLGQEVIDIAQEFGTDALAAQRFLNMADQIKIVQFEIDTLAQLLDPRATILAPVDTSLVLPAAKTDTPEIQPISLAAPVDDPEKEIS